MWWSSGDCYESDHTNSADLNLICESYSDYSGSHFDDSDSDYTDSDFDDFDDSHLDSNDSDMDCSDSYADDSDNLDCDCSYCGHFPHSPLFALYWYKWLYDSAWSHLIVCHNPHTLLHECGLATIWLHLYYCEMYRDSLRLRDTTSLKQWRLQQGLRKPGWMKETERWVVHCESKQMSGLVSNLQTHSRKTAKNLLHQPVGPHSSGFGFKHFSNREKSDVFSSHH